MFKQVAFNRMGETLMACLLCGVGFAAQPAAVSGELEVIGFSLPDEIATARVERFEQLYPDVNLKVTEGAFDAQQFLTAVATRNVPDLVYMNRDDLSTYAARGALEPLTACVAEQEIAIDQFRQPALEQVTLEDELYGIPEFYNIIALILNDEALAGAGVTADDVNTSDWTALTETANKLTRVENGSLERIGFDPKLPEFFPLWVKGNGGEFLSADGRTAYLNSPEAVEALTYAVSLHEPAGGRQAFLAFRDTWDFFGTENEYAQDQLAAMPMEQWYLNVLAEVSPEAAITVKPFTDRKGAPLTFATGSAWAIPRGSANPEAACAFMKTMTEAEAWVTAAKVRAAARAAAGLPFTGVYTANEIADEQIFGTIVPVTDDTPAGAAVQAVLAVQSNAFSIPANPAGAEFKQAWTDAVNRVLNQEQDAQAALDQAQTEAQSALDEAWSQ